MLTAVLFAVYGVLTVVLIGIILIQEPKSAGGLGAAFGGGAEGVLGVRGAPTFFTKATAVGGGLYMLLSLIISLMNSPAKMGATTIEEGVKKGDIYKYIPNLGGEEEGHR